MLFYSTKRIENLLQIRAKSIFIMDGTGRGKPLPFFKFPFGISSPSLPTKHIGFSLRGLNSYTNNAAEWNRALAIP